MTHSPLPWRINELPLVGDFDWEAHSVVDGNGDIVLSGARTDEWAGTLENKRFIVRAVNAHAGLMAVLREILGIMYQTHQAQAKGYGHD